MSVRVCKFECVCIYSRRRFCVRFGDRVLVCTFVMYMWVVCMFGYAAHSLIVVCDEATVAIHDQFASAKCQDN